VFFFASPTFLEYDIKEEIINEPNGGFAVLNFQKEFEALKNSIVENKI
jgi:hypothetical protein